MYILGIDIGIINLGLIGCSINDDYTLNKIELCELVDITDFRCNQRKCSLNHEPNVAYRMKHFFLNYREYFNKADYIIIERQPIMGITDVQEIILYEFDSKCILISPNAMHKHFDINDLNYERRKEQTIKMSEHLLKEFKDFNNNERKHDMGDALCLIKYFLYNKHKEYMDKKRLDDWKKINHNILTTLESYKFDPTILK